MYTLTVTPRQLALIRDAVETCARLGIGQFRDALTWPLAEDGSRPCDTWDVQTRVEAICKPLLGLSPNASRGVNWRDEPDMLWDIYATIRHRMSWDAAIDGGIVKPGETRKWPEMMGVNYDPPMHYGPEPLPEVARNG
jgi:hypothetical protein